MTSPSLNNGVSTDQDPLSKILQNFLYVILPFVCLDLQTAREVTSWRCICKQIIVRSKIKQVKLYKIVWIGK